MSVTLKIDGQSVLLFRSCYFILVLEDQVHRNLEIGLFCTIQPWSRNRYPANVSELSIRGPGWQHSTVTSKFSGSKVYFRDRRKIEQGGIVTADGAL